ncbi:hypothetical protein SLEP1_g14674 [Rubroshorea leprosula]|uniref:Uncharacterized protein n=1 Tax=Rubroshorea leprosula TaxID=152421 RepID=A0AAV5IP96_9ROSI|nr:hypothetical protein SLEP1_g14674 [Rubroshorea leprosula]
MHTGFVFNVDAKEPSLAMNPDFICLHIIGLVYWNVALIANKNNRTSANPLINLAKLFEILAQSRGTT